MSEFDYLPDDLWVARQVYKKLSGPQYDYRMGPGLQYPMLVEWEVSQVDVLGNTISTSKATNLVVNTGRTQLLNLGFIPGGSANGGFYYLGVGASATAAAVTDTRLTYELIGNATRKTLTNTSGTTPQNSDIVAETITISGCTFYEKLILQAIYTTSDGNNNNTFNEYGIFTTSALPASPTGTSGNMFNHFIDPSPAFKTSSNQVICQVTVRF